MTMFDAMSDFKNDFFMLINLVNTELYYFSQKKNHIDLATYVQITYL